MLETIQCVVSMATEETSFEKIKQSLNNAYRALRAFMTLTEDVEREKRRIIRQAVEAAEVKKRAHIISKINSL